MNINTFAGRINSIKDLFKYEVYVNMNNFPASCALYVERLVLLFKTISREESKLVSLCKLV